MAQTAFVTGADRGLGSALVAGLLEQGWCVFAGQHRPAWPELGALAARYPSTLHRIPLEVTALESVRAAAQAVSSVVDHLDLLINNAGVGTPAGARSIHEAQDYAEMQRVYDVNALGPLRMVDAFLPLTGRGTGKRLCFVSSEAGSIARATRTREFGYCMSKAALNMATKILHNDLHHAGYTFRIYHPGWIRSYMSGSKATEGDMEPEEAAGPALAYFLQPREDEDRLVLRDWLGREWPW
ncbi:MAG TPA: SDR family NAD(P)-dependent oxidoreductase [Chloroflexia bacterium]|nr:SDR family NAD(P)-dependent oxidoreductase [Chloroflexia bacterium]